MDDELDPSEEFISQTPLGDLVSSISKGDIDATAQQLRDTTSFQFSESVIWGIIGVAGINAIANLVRRAQPLAQPIADAAGERMRQPPAL